MAQCREHQPIWTRGTAVSRQQPTEERLRMKRIDLVTDKKGGGWVAESGGEPVRGTRAPTKEEAIKKTANAAKRDPEAVTVKIYKENGSIQEERTYPRKADPRSRKG